MESSTQLSELITCQPGLNGRVVVGDPGAQVIFPVEQGKCIGGVMAGACPYVRPISPLKAFFPFEPGHDIRGERECGQG